MRKLQLQNIQSATEQSAGRARALREEGATVYLFSNLVIRDADEVIDRQRIGDGGMLRDSPNGLIKSRPPRSTYRPKAIIEFPKTNRGIYECSKELYAIEMRLEMTTPHQLKYAL